MAPISVGDSTVDYEQIGTGPSLVLLPTLLAEMSVYDLVIEELASERRVPRFNFPGFGASTGPIGETIEDYANLIVGAMDELSIPQETDLLANGFGGFVAGTMAINHGDRFKKLVLVDTGPGFPEPAKEPVRILARKSVSEGMSSVLDAAILRMFPEDFIAHNQKIVEQRKARLSDTDPNLFANAALSLVKLDNRPKLKDIDNETLVVVGLADATTPPELSHELNKGIKGSKLIELPGIGHCPQLQDPSQFLQAVKPFLGYSI